MKYVIKLLEHVGKLIDGDPGEPEGQYVVSYDPEAYGGRGNLVGSRDIARAQRFDSVEAAYRFIRQQPACKPVRDDGKPNRPIMAYNLGLDPVPE